MIEATHSVAAAGQGAPAKAILIGGLAGGVLDLGFAFTAWALKGVGPGDILRSIASGLLGPAARTGFAPVPLGLVSHFLLAFLFAAAFVLVAMPVGLGEPGTCFPDACARSLFGADSAAALSSDERSVGKEALPHG